MRLAACLLLWSRAILGETVKEISWSYPRCLDASGHGKQLRNLTLGGVQRPVGLVAANWASAIFLSKIMLILLREQLGINVVVTDIISTSIIAVENLAGCASGTGCSDVGIPVPHDFALEVWLSSAGTLLAQLDDSVRPMSAGSTGFVGSQGIYVRDTAVKQGRLQGLHLEFYRTYASNSDTILQYFDRYEDVISTLKEEDLQACDSDPRFLRSTDRAEQLRLVMGDKGGTRWVNSTHGSTKVYYNCSGPGAAVWYSPACRSDPRKCIPVLSSSGWGLISAGLDQKYVKHNMPVAVINMKRETYTQMSLSKSRGTLFYAWSPDATFSLLEPVQVLFAPHDPDEWKRNIRVTDQRTTPVQKMTRNGFRAEAPRELWTVLEGFSIGLRDVTEYLTKWKDAKGDVAALGDAKEDEVSCSWVLSNKHVWEKWLPRICQEGYYAPLDEGDCLPCLAGFYCPPGTMEDEMKEDFRCMFGHRCPDGSAAPVKCPAGEYSSVLGATECTPCPVGSSTDAKSISRNISDCVRCAVGTYFVQGTCSVCPLGTFTDTAGSSICKECNTWMGFNGSNDDRTGCRFYIGQTLFLLSCFFFMLLILCGVLKWMRTVADDRPDRPETKTGSWVLSWVGPFVHRRIHQALPSRRSQRVTKGPKSQFDQRRGWCKCRNCSFRRQAWMVNATPFDINIEFNDGIQVLLKADTFQKNRHRSTDELGLVVSSGSVNGLGTTEDTEFVIRSGDWKENRVIESDSGTVHDLSFQAVSKVTRFLFCLLPGCCKKIRGDDDGRSSEAVRSHAQASIYRGALQSTDGRSMGDVKLVSRWSKSDSHRAKILLVLWSPPHVYRGMPMTQFESFLETVVQHPGRWDGSRRKERTMYSACKYFLKKEVTIFDASYAELHTDYGHSDVFISHVWGETAYNTRRAMSILDDLMRSRNPDSMSVASCRHGSEENLQEVFRSEQTIQSEQTTADITATFDGFMTMAAGKLSSEPFSPRRLSLKRTLTFESNAVQNHSRVWFCTCCNNQARVVEELGNDVNESPFAQVLRSECCKLVALVSPLKALERKWCNYEFCLAANECNLETLMVTRDGVVQAGQVAPKILNQLSQKLVNFSCAQATCKSKEDELLIDNAVTRLGGYKVLDSKLMSIFHSAIAEALFWAQQAHDRLDASRKDARPPSERCTLSECERGEVAVVLGASNASQGSDIDVIGASNASQGRDIDVLGASHANQDSEHLDLNEQLDSENSLGVFLGKMGLRSWKAKFDAIGVQTVDDLRYVENEDLIEFGLSQIQRRKFLHGLGAMGKPKKAKIPYASL